MKKQAERERSKSMAEILSYRKFGREQLTRESGGTVFVYLQQIILKCSHDGRYYVVCLEVNYCYALNFLNAN